jgi:hypothetical protein
MVMPSKDEFIRNLTATDFAYFQMGLTVGCLNAHGVTLPTETLIDPNNYIIRPDGKTVMSPLAPLHELRPLHDPPAELSVQDILGVLLPLKVALPSKHWPVFGAGYLKSMEESVPALQRAARSWPEDGQEEPRQLEPLRL